MSFTVEFSALRTLTQLTAYRLKTAFLMTSQLHYDQLMTYYKINNTLQSFDFAGVITVMRARVTKIFSDLLKSCTDQRRSLFFLWHRVYFAQFDSLVWIVTCSKDLDRPVSRSHFLSVSQLHQWLFLIICQKALFQSSHNYAGFVIGRSRVRPPVYALSRNNFGQVVYMHVPLSTKQYKLVPASAGT